MKKFYSRKTLLAASGVAALIALGITAANADGMMGKDGRKGGGRANTVTLSDRPKTIVIDNLDTAVFKDDGTGRSSVAQTVCADCHSSDYPTTQPKLSCNGWAKEVNKMGKTFRAYLPWSEIDPSTGTTTVTYGMLTNILYYLADNYGTGSAGCTSTDLGLITAIPHLNP